MIHRIHYVDRLRLPQLSGGLADEIWWICGCMDCSDFCSDPTIKRPHPDTAGHMLSGPLSACFSERLLNDKGLWRMELLLCKQGVGGSSPPTSTNLILFLG